VGSSFGLGDQRSVIQAGSINRLAYSAEPSRPLLAALTLRRKRWPLAGSCSTLVRSAGSVTSMTVSLSVLCAALPRTTQIHNFSALT
jgi:hypothetical protein